MRSSSFPARFWGHLKTITLHKLRVTRLCFKMGLIKQGLLHDLSKYSPVEFWAGVRYFQGNRSPIDAEKEAKGYSEGWLHHKGHNKHHWEYWIDPVSYTHLSMFPFYGISHEKEVETGRSPRKSFCYFACF